MSELFAKAPDKTVNGAKLVTEQFRTCGTCVWAVLDVRQPDMISCHGVPPTPVALGAGQDQLGRLQIRIEAMRAALPPTTRGCSLHKPKSALVV